MENNLMLILPFELQTAIWKQYFTKHVLNAFIDDEEDDEYFTMEYTEEMHLEYLDEINNENF